MRYATGTSRLLFLSMVLLVGGCSDAGVFRPLVPDPATLYWQLEADQPAIILSTYAPYDTVQLHVTPRNVFGDALSHEGTVMYRKLSSVDTAITIDSQGFVRATAPSLASRIEVTLQMDGITHGDTIEIMVRNDFPVRFLDSLRFRPGTDSTWRWTGVNTTFVSGQPYKTWLKAFVRDTIQPQSQVMVGYTYDDPRIMEGSMAEVTGETWIRARTYAYGRELVDSIRFRRILPTVALVVVRQLFPASGVSTIDFNPQIITVKSGTTIIFINRGLMNEGAFTNGNDTYYKNVAHYGDVSWVDSVDIVFDTPEAAEAADSYGALSFSDLLSVIRTTLTSSLAVFRSDGSSGNISAFGLVWTRPFNPIRSTLDVGWRSRKFTQPGTYPYRSTRYPGVTGTIIVTE